MSYRIKKTGNRKPQLTVIDFEIVEDIIVRGWDVETSFPIRYKHLMGHPKSQTVTDEDIERILDCGDEDEMSSPDEESEVDATDNLHELGNARVDDPGPSASNQVSVGLQKSKRPNLTKGKRQTKTTDDAQMKNKGSQTDPHLLYHVPVFGTGTPGLGSIPYLSRLVNFG